jgi:DNA-binding MarR family transcriptional regulator
MADSEGKGQEPSGVSELEAHLGYWLRAVSNHVSHAFKTKVERRGATVAEWVVLRALFDADGVKPSELAAKLGLTRGAISKLVDRLVAKIG